MKLKGKLPTPSLTATLREPVGNAWRIVEIHQRNSFDCPMADVPR